MLDFFRKHAVSIALSIVVFFVGTLFTGIFFLRGITPTQQDPSTDRSQAVAVIGDQIVPRQIYVNSFQNILSQVQQQPEFAGDPEEIEWFKFAALQQAVQYTLLLEGAIQNNVKVSRQEITFALHDFYNTYNMSGKKELKVFLAANNIPYKTFLSSVKNEIMVQKMRQSFQSQTSVTDSDLKNQYRSIKAQHILFRPNPQTDASNPEEADKQALDRAESTLAKIHAGLGFEDAAKQFSDDDSTRNNGGTLGWLTIGSVSKEFEDAAFSLAKYEVSSPVRTPFGYHLIKISGTRTRKRPKDSTPEKEKAAIFQKRYQQLLSHFLTNLRGPRSVTILDPELRAIDAKNRGDFMTAKGAYQTLISQAPSNPLPRYLLAKLYLRQKKLADAKQELQRADLLTNLNPALDIAQIHMELAKLYQQEKAQKKAETQYDKAIARAANKRPVLTYLKQSFEALQDKKRLKKVNQALEALEKPETSRSIQSK